jgi:hypothetical protein
MAWTRLKMSLWMVVVETRVSQCRETRRSFAWSPLELSVYEVSIQNQILIISTCLRTIKHWPWKSASRAVILALATLCFWIYWHAACALYNAVQYWYTVISWYSQWRIGSIPTTSWIAQAQRFYESLFIDSSINEQKVRSKVGEELWTQVEVKVFDMLESIKKVKFGWSMAKSTTMEKTRNSLGLERKTKITNESDQQNIQADYLLSTNKCNSACAPRCKLAYQSPSHMESSPKRQGFSLTPLVKPLKCRGRTIAWAF